MKLTPVTRRLGAEIEGIRTADGVSSNAVADIYQALLDRKVLFFRDQDMTLEDHWSSVASSANWSCTRS